MKKNTNRASIQDNKTKKRAFIFDMDGVIVDSETIWPKYEHIFFKKIIEESMKEKLGDLTGISIQETYKKAQEFGFNMPYDQYQ